MSLAVESDADSVSKVHRLTAPVMRLAIKKVGSMLLFASVSKRGPLEPLIGSMSDHRICPDANVMRMERLKDTVQRI